MVRSVASMSSWLIRKRAIITGKESKYNNVGDLKGSTFGISRQGR